MTLKELTSFTIIFFIIMGIATQSVLGAVVGTAILWIPLFVRLLND